MNGFPEYANRAVFDVMATEAVADVAARRISSREEAARHEAGHAVAAIVICRLVPGVNLLPASTNLSLNPRGDLTPEHRHRRLGWTQPAARATTFRYAMAVTLWAGSLAEGSLRGAVSDLRYIKQAGPAYLIDRGPDSAFSVARELVAANLHAIDAVAAALLADGRLIGSQIAALVDGAPGVRA
jgi:hypothetical protein